MIYIRYLVFILILSLMFLLVPESIELCQHLILIERIIKKRKQKQTLKKKRIRLWNISIVSEARTMYLFTKSKLGNVTFCRMKRKKTAENSRKLMNYLANSSVAFVLRRYLRSLMFFRRHYIHQWAVSELYIYSYWDYRHICGY